MRKGREREKKPLQCVYHQETEDVADVMKTYQWLEKSGLKDNTEALTMEAQEQALTRRSIHADPYGGGQ